MSTVRYTVLQADMAWKIVGERRHIGPFLDRDSAICTAARLGREAGDSGLDVELSVQDASGAVTIIDCRDERYSNSACGAALQAHKASLGAHEVERLAQEVFGWLTHPSPADAQAPAA